MKVNKFFFRPVILILFLTSFSACMNFGFKPKASRSPKRLFETYYVGPSLTQYFVKPLRFTAAKEEVMADITFRTVKDDTTKGNFNFTLTQSAPVSRVDSAFIIIANTTVLALGQPILLHTAPKKDKINTRYSATVTSQALMRLLKQNGFNIRIYRKGVSSEFISAGKTAKALKTLGTYFNTIEF